MSPGKRIQYPGKGTENVREKGWVMGHLNKGVPIEEQAREDPAGNF